MSPEPPSQKAWRARNRTKINRRVRQNRLEHPEVWAVRDLKMSLKRRGVTIEWFNETLAAQDNLCAICKQPETRIDGHGGIRRLAVDHDHETNKVRELLCQRCNLGIGWLDSIELLTEAIKYLTRHKE